MAADIKMQWGDKKHELNVSTYHMCILLLFNEADQHSYPDILTATNIPAGDLKRALQSLALVKVSHTLCLCTEQLASTFALEWISGLPFCIPSGICQGACPKHLDSSSRHLCTHITRLYDSY